MKVTQVGKGTFLGESQLRILKEIILDLEYTTLHLQGLEIRWEVTHSYRWVAIWRSDANQYQRRQVSWASIAVMKHRDHKVSWGEKGLLSLCLHIPVHH